MYKEGFITTFKENRGVGLKDKTLTVTEQAKMKKGSIFIIVCFLGLIIGSYFITPFLAQHFANDGEIHSIYYTGFLHSIRIFFGMLIVTIMLYEHRNLQGRLVSVKRGTLEAINTDFNQRLSSVPKGLYWIELTYEGEQYRLRLVKQ